MFICAFCESIKQPNARPSDNDWFQTTLIQMRGEIVTCNCGRAVFVGNVR